MSDRIAGRYERIATLGSGAFGDVYKVRDAETGEIRAVKVLRSGTGNVSVMARFEREFSVISRLNHPAVVRVYDYGLHEESPYYSMEFLEGVELKEFQEQFRPPAHAVGYEIFAERIAYVFHQIADGLAAVHDAGLLHRDVKPENIFVRPSRYPRAKLLDFGHARDDDNQDLTKTGTVMGTAWYIAPEQATAADPTPAADLYSLGCCLFEALVGTPPYTGGNVIDVLMGHIRKPVPDPREKEPRVSDELAEVCRLLLQKQPPDRPDDAATVARMLGEL